MGWFTPKCPTCGNEVTATGWALPEKQWRCTTCMSRNRARRKLEQLEARLEKLEKEKENDQ